MRLGHISDFHLRCHLAGTSTVLTRRSREMPEKINLAIQRFREENVDCVVVTGDLVDHPFEDMNIPEYLEKGEADLLLVRDLLDQLDCPVFVVYGNHDHPLLFRRVFSLREESSIVGDFRIHCFYDEEGRNNTPERVGGELERFLEATSNSDEYSQIHIQHYLLYPEKNDGYPHTYLNSTSLIKSASSSEKVTLALSGHFHPGENLVQYQGIYFAVAPAFCEPPHPFRIYDLSPPIIQTQHLNLS